MFINFTSMPGDLRDWITHIGLSPLMIVGAMVLLTILVFFPIVTAWVLIRCGSVC